MHFSSPAAGLIGAQTHVFERQAHQRRRPALLRFDGHQRGQRLLDLVARGLGQRVSVAGGAGGGITRAAGGENHRVGKELLPRLRRHALAVTFVGHQRRDAAVIANLHIQPFQLPAQGLNDIVGMVGNREHALTAFHLQRNAQRLDQLHKLLIAQRSEGGVHEPRIAQNAAHELLFVRRVGHVAAALARDVDLFAQLFISFQQQHTRACPSGKERGHHAGRASAHNDQFFLAFVILPILQDIRRICPRSAPCCQSNPSLRGGGAGPARRSAR